jgi:murein DD-endopeptidase MepM/ murein hydrolase activator NlpD
MYVTPDGEHNPIDPPERFTGYHAGLDYEIRESELRTDVPVYAICDGSVLYSGFAEGYGGLLVQRCMIENEEVTVLYGHLAQEDMMPEGETPKAGEQLGILAAHRTLWSGWNRKHLHLGIHRGADTDMRGYVESAEELEAFVNPASVLPRSATGRPVSTHRVVGPTTRDEAIPEERFDTSSTSSVSS